MKTLTTADLHRELNRRTRRVRSLQRKRDRLWQRAEAVGREIKRLGGSVNGSEPGRKRPRNAVRLVDALAKTLKGKTMSVTEAADAVQANGYRTSSTNFRVIVNQTLIGSGRFRRVSRGMYTAKGK